MKNSKGVNQGLLLIGVLFAFVFVCCKSPVKESSNVNTSSDQENEGAIVKKSGVMPYDTFSYDKFDVIASYLSGVLPEDSIEKHDKVFQSAVWKQFSVRFRPYWERYENNDLAIVKQWAADNIKYADSVIYPFSGPDFNYLNTFFPDVNYSLLIALEGVGSIPKISDMDDSVASVLLTEIEKSLYFNLKCSFFRTFSMEDELNSNVLNGTIPLLMFFIKSHGYELVNLYPVWINKDGVIEADTTGSMYSHSTNKTFDYAAAFVYREPGDSALRELVYMSLDLSDDGIAENDLLPFLKKYLSHNTVFMKAASYLCHRPAFHVIRDEILNNAEQIIADPSGIHYDDYTDDWELTVHGRYIGPIKLFGTRMQQGLKTLCEENGNKNLPFRFGYHYTDWCLIDAHRK